MSIELTEQEIENLNSNFSSFNIDTGITGEPGECIPGSEELLVIEGIRELVTRELSAGRVAHMIHHINGDHVSIFKITA